MITGAAVATINRLPVLLLPSDTFAVRVPHPVLQQLEVAHDATVSVNDCFKPVSRFFDRVDRPAQLIPAALEAMRVLTDQADTGAVTIALPEDVQTEAFDVPAAFLEQRVWTIFRQPPAPEALARAAGLIGSAKRPLIVAGGGVIYSEATRALRAFVDATGIPVCETQAGRGALVSDHPLSLGAVGATGSAAGNQLAHDADLVIGIGTRWSDFTTASKSAFQDPDVRFINVNVTSFDAAKHSGLPLLGDARVVLEQLGDALSSGGYRASAEWTARATAASAGWAATVADLVAPTNARPLRQAEVIGAVNDAAGETGIVVNAAGAMPADLHKLWRARDPDGKGYHVEYGYSCMGYEIPGSIGVKLAAPERRVFTLIGDGTWLMLSSELATAVEQRIPLTVIVVDNQGYMSIGALSRSLGSAGFATHFKRALDGGPILDSDDGTQLATPAESLRVDFAANAASLGAHAIQAHTIDELRTALADAQNADGPVVICVEADRYDGVPGFESWWDVPVAEVSQSATVRAARDRYEDARRHQRLYLEHP
jgi:3D-(3,5/4)-trihydroxycyclohexane-1,2-dione acylhydrolase (decyclizing)